MLSRRWKKRFRPCELRRSNGRIYIGNSNASGFPEDVGQYFWNKYACGSHTDLGHFPGCRTYRKLIFCDSYRDTSDCRSLSASRVKFGADPSCKLFCVFDYRHPAVVDSDYYKFRHCRFEDEGRIPADVRGDLSCNVLRYDSLRCLYVCFPEFSISIYLGALYKEVRATE